MKLPVNRIGFKSNPVNPVDAPKIVATIASQRDFKGHEMTTTTLERLALRTCELTDKATRVVWWKVVANMILFVPALGTCPFDVMDRSALGTTRVPDDFLSDIANFTTASKNGLRFLSNAIDEKGWLSVSEAIRFIEIESDQHRIAEAKATRGLAALKARLHRETV